MPEERSAPWREAEVAKLIVGIVEKEAKDCWEWGGCIESVRMGNGVGTPGLQL